MKRLLSFVSVALVSALALGANPITEQESIQAVRAEEKQLVRLDGSVIEISEIERRIPQLMESVWLPGMSVIVIQDGAIAYRQSFGVRDARSGEKFSDQTCFTGLSFSKTITAYLAMRLVDNGQLDLDRPLHQYLAKPVPEYEFYADLEGDLRYRAITARHVLSHTTGWPNWRWFTDDDKLTFLFEPGERHSYSGEGFAFLQLALEEATGKSLATLTQDEVFKPLDMMRSSMVWQDEYASDFAEDHDFLGRPLRRERYDNASAAGSLQTTIEDYARFLLAVLNSQGLSSEARDEMLDPQLAIRHRRMFGPLMYEETPTNAPRGLGWTLGWGRVMTDSGEAFFHTGNDRGSANYTIAFPERRTAIVLMGNSNRLEGIAEDVVELLTADRSSPFDFLGYEPWDGPRQTWLRTLANEGVAAGMAYWTSLGDTRSDFRLDQESAFQEGAQALAHFDRQPESRTLLTKRRELFPASAQAVRDLVTHLLDEGLNAEATESLRQALEEPGPRSSDLAQELEWFQAWAKTRVSPADVASEGLATLVGEFEVRRVELRSGRLFYGRDATPPEDYNELIPMGDDTFIVEAFDFFRLRFERDDAGRAIRVLGLYEDGRTDSNERTDP